MFRAKNARFGLILCNIKCWLPVCNKTDITSTTCLIKNVKLLLTQRSSATKFKSDRFHLIFLPAQLTFQGQH